jgi:hypothetical protein
LGVNWRINQQAFQLEVPKIRQWLATAVNQRLNQPQASVDFSGGQADIVKHVIKLLSTSCPSQKAKGLGFLNNSSPLAFNWTLAFLVRSDDFSRRDREEATEVATTNPHLPQPPRSPGRFSSSSAGVESAG